MTRQILLMLSGLPGSGKSTFARKLLSGEEKFEAANGEELIWKRVNKDDLREMIHNGKFTKHNEKDIIRARDVLVNAYLSDGYSVIVDDTGFNKVHEKALRKIAESCGASFYEKFIDTPLEDCIKNDLKRDRSVGKDVIMKMHEQYIRPLRKVEQDPSLQHAVIFDMDGTLSLMGSRDPYNASTCESDEPNVPVVELCKMLKKEGKAIIIMSGRAEQFKPQTMRWLAKHDISIDAIFMRPDDDWTKDSIMKKKLFIDNVLPRWYIEYAVDDRWQVAEQCWRDMGITCLQVATGNF